MGLPRIKSMQQIEINGAIIAHSERGVCMGGARLLAGRCRGEISPLVALLSSHQNVVLFMPNECACFVWLLTSFIPLVQ